MNENPVTKKNWIPLAACLAIILVSAFFGFTVGKFSNHQEAFLTETRLSDSHYRFTNPLLDYQPAPPALITRNIRELEDNLNEFIESEIEQSHIINASVYYRDLENGPWISVNGDNEYTPASLLKVPLLIAYYKQAEKDPSILTRSITYKDEFSSIPSHNLEHTPSTINLGDTYTVSELLEMMIKQSDNIATLLLEANIESEQAEQVFLDFDIPLPDFVDPRKSNTTARQYAGVFRILYNGTYLSKDYSEKALGLLSETNFTDGLVAGVPATVLVSHKFGVSNDGDTKQLHDCGIVYDETIRTYTICVMTSGSDYTQMAQTIEHISAMVYNSLSENTQK